MNILLEFECDLKRLNQFSQDLAKESQQGDIFFLAGDLGVGKTTFAKLFIKRPSNIKSPSYPIMINYPLLNYEIFHYDLFRIKNKDELTEIDFFEDLNKNIFIIEWPNLILNNFTLKSYYLIEFEFINLSKRNLKVKHSTKLQFNGK